MSKVASCEQRGNRALRFTFYVLRFTPLLSLLAIIVLLLGLAAPSLALAQQGQRKMTLNQVGNATWPDVTLNLTLVGPDGKAIPDVLPAQFQVFEQGQQQNLIGLEL